MSGVLRGPITLLGRLLLCTIFFMAAVGNKIPHFSDVAKVMESVGIPAHEKPVHDGSDALYRGKWIGADEFGKAM